MPVFWAQGPEPYAGALLFRVGRADETLPTAGVSHLVEHLALFPLGRRSHLYGGFVDDTRTVFHSSGTPAEVSAVLGSVCNTLSGLPAERLANERRVLLAEAASSPSRGPLWSLRFGPRSYGLVAFTEIGLHTLTAEDVQSWAATRFTKGNAVAWFNGPPPEDLQFDLPDGEHDEPPVPEDLADLELPAYAVSEGTGFAVSLLTRRSTAAATAAFFLRERLQEHLRRDLGLTYAADVVYWRLNRDFAHLIVGADSTPGHAATVRDGLLRVMYELAESGASDEELERYLTDTRRYAAEPAAVAAKLDNWASNELADARQLTSDELAAELQALTPADVAEAFAKPLERRLLSVPPGVSLDGQVKPWGHGWAESAASGKKYDYSDGPGSVTIGPEGVSDEYPGAPAVTVRYDDCVLVALEADYGATVFNSRGQSVFFRFNDEKSREEMLAPILEHCRSEIVVQLHEEVRQRQKNIGALAATQLSGNLVGQALNVLAQVMFDGEEASNLARADYDGKKVLLALTTMRLLCLEHPSGQLLVDLPLADVARADRKGRLLGADLLVETSGSVTLKFAGMNPGSRAGEFADTMSAGIRGSG